jgi:hypothetical protein
MAMKGKTNVRTKIIMNNNTIEQVDSFNYLGYIITVSNNEIKMNRFHQMCSTVLRILNNKTRKETQIKYYRVMAVRTLTYGSEMWTIIKKKMTQN